MDLESLETQTLLKKRTPQHQSLALKLAVLLGHRLGLLAWRDGVRRERVVRDRAETNFHGAFALNHAVDLRAIDTRDRRDVHTGMARRQARRSTS